ncbi:MAG TPA: outer membrane lipoprotein-sorting protein [Chthonomonadaceae bacterium]|nr:outer membrane lipoprotein-sorting protein [Chthonomonadaceae bacterium]
MNAGHYDPGRLFVLLVGCALSFGLLCPANAQSRHSAQAPEASSEKPENPAPRSGTRIPKPQVVELGDTVAIIPWNYKNGKDPAVESAHEVCSQLLLATGLNVFLIKTATGAMPPPMTGVSGSKKVDSPFAHIWKEGKRAVTQDAPDKPNAVFILPTLDEMIEIGERLNTRYVLAGRAQWRSRDVWIGVSNRIKAICTVDLVILDVNSRHLVLDAHGVEGDSTENKNLYDTFNNIVSLNPLPLVLPGSITPQEQRAVTVAISRAIHPWLKAERVRMALSQADESSEGESEFHPTPKFSTLIQPPDDLEATLQVTTKDPKPLEAIDKDVARLYALHDVTLEYKDPDKLRLTTNSPKDGKETLLFDGEQRSFTIEKGKSGKEQNLSDTPFKRSFLFEYCGVLTQEMFETLRARFVKQEPLEGVPTVVYDLTYWGQDEGPYCRVWIDPEKRLILKRECFDKDSKLKTIERYKQPTEVAPNLWLPGSVEMADGKGAVFTTVKLTRVKVNQGIPDSAFRKRPS